MDWPWQYSSLCVGAVGTLRHAPASGCFRAASLGRLVAEGAGRCQGGGVGREGGQGGGAGRGGGQAERGGGQGGEAGRLLGWVGWSQE